MDMRTDLTAVPHASLGYHFLRVQVKPNGGWGSSNRSEAQSASTKSTSSDRQSDGGPCTSAQLKGINGHQLRLTMRPGAPSRYVFTTAWMGLRWPMPSKCPWALCLKQNKTIQKNPCDYKGRTHSSEMYEIREIGRFSLQHFGVPCDVLRLDVFTPNDVSSLKLPACSSRRICTSLGRLLQLRSVHLL